MEGPPTKPTGSQIPNPKKVLSQLLLQDNLQQIQKEDSV